MLPRRTPVGQQRHRPPFRAGLTLLELLVALSVMVMVVGTLGGLARAVQSGAAYSEGCADATQHARVALERITRSVDEAFANQRFPGFIVVAEQEGRWRFPDTLVVWHPDPGVLAAYPGRPALDDPNRLPYHDEVVVYCPDPDAPGRLVEIRSTRDVPLGADPAAWPTEIQVFKDSMSLDAAIFSSAGSRSPDYPAVTLTERMRTGRSGDSGPAEPRGAVRFESLLRPSDEQWNDSSIAWESLPWVQGMYGAKTAMRQAWLRVELQLLSGDTAGQSGSTGSQATAFFASAAVYYAMHRELRP
ncbi:MAG: hypothetical protein HUU20_17410 [Pirellulales bacterium]|nr:hypothetical protein [Pirellulales bacterium]